ncbi:MAG: hypothetical protein AB1715_12450 [Acidobacteriota bacterium]
MKELFSHLSEKEKSRLRLLGLLLLVAVIFLIVAAFGQRRSYYQLADRLREREKASAAAAARRDEAAAKWAGWEEAYADIKDIKDKYFYREEDGVKPLRIDLQKIFAESGISARSFRYNQVNLEREKVKKINVTFNFSGSYPILKRFLQTVEQFPKFLLLEKIDFLKVSADGNLLELKIVLAGYNANF